MDLGVMRLSGRGVYRYVFVAFVVAAVVWSVQAVSAEDWAQWRGADRLAVWHETGIVDSFPDTGLKVEWRAPIRSGWAGPAVAGGRVFVLDWLEDPESRTLDGTERLVALDDGSKITLNTDSQVRVEMTSAARRIVMDRGEAYFEVAPDPLRPFTVEVGGQAVTAYGTAFNLRRLGDGFTLALMDGCLALHRQGGEPPIDPPWLDSKGDPGGVEQTIGEGLGLRAGTVVHFNAHTQTMRARHEPGLGQRQHWRQGRLSFRDQPMSAVIAELSRYSEKPIRIHDAHIGDTRVFATLQLDSIDGALATLENALPIRVVPKVSEIVIMAAHEESSLQGP